MPSAQEDENQESKSNNDQSTDSEQPQSSATNAEKNGKTKKKTSKKGFSILGALAKFMSNEKSESSYQVEPLPEIEEQDESIPASPSPPNEPVEPIVPEYAEVSSQTSDIIVRQSSTLIAISNAVQALQGLRRRIAMLPQQAQEKEIKETQTSSSLLPQQISIGTSVLSHDSNLLLKNKSFKDDQDSTGSQSTEHPSLNTVGPAEENEVPQEVTTDRQVNSDKSLSRVSFYETPEYFKTNVPSAPSPSDSGANESVDSSNNDQKEQDKDTSESNDSSKVLFQSTPNLEKRKSDGIKIVSLYPPSKVESVQTEPVMEGKKTQTVLLSDKVNNSDKTVVDYPGPGDENSLSLRILRDRAKCSKCDLFELMLLHGGDKIFNDKEMTGMFKKHLNSHLLKAQEDLNKLYKWPQRITDVEDVTEGQSHRRKASVTDGKRVEEIAIRPNNGYASNNFDENKYHRTDEELASVPTKNKLGTPPPPEKQIIINVNDDEIGTSIEKNSNTENVFQMAKVKRRKSSDRDGRQPRAQSPSSYDQLLKDNLSSPRQRDYSDEVIIKRKHDRPIDRYNRRDSFKKYDDDIEHYHVANERKKSHNRYRRNSMEYKRDHAGDDYTNRCYCCRSKCLPASNLINSGHWNKDSSEDEKCDCRQYCAVSNNVYSCTSSRSPRQSDKMELRLKWFAKGVLAALKDHQEDVKRTESKKEKRGAVPKEGQLEKTTNESGEMEKTESSSLEENREMPSDQNEKDSSAVNGKRGNRGGTVLSNIAFFMVKEDVNKHNKDGQTLGEGEQPDLSSGKQEMENKPNSEQLVQQTENGKDSALPTANKSKLNSGVQNGSGGGSENETVLHNNSDLEDSKVQKLVEDILSAYCRVEVSGRRENSQRNQCDSITNPNFCSDEDSDEIVQQVCNFLTTKAHVPLETSSNPDKEDNQKGRETSSPQRLACSYFYPFNDDDNNLSSTSSSRLCYFRSVEPRRNTNQPEQSNKYNGGPLPLPKSFQQNQTCFHRIETRQECISNFKRARREHEPQQQQRHGRQPMVVEGSNNCRRPFTAPAWCSGNSFCGCGVNTNINSNIASGNSGNQGCYTWEPFTYVVPQSQVYWRNF